MGTVKIKLRNGVDKEICNVVRLFCSAGSLIVFNDLAMSIKVKLLYWLLFYFYIGGKVEEY